MNISILLWMPKTWKSFQFYCNKHCSVELREEILVQKVKHSLWFARICLLGLLFALLFAMKSERAFLNIRNLQESLQTLFFNNVAGLRPSKAMGFFHEEDRLQNYPVRMEMKNKTKSVTQLKHFRLTNIRWSVSEW